MLTSLQRATFGRLTNISIVRATLARISVEDGLTPVYPPQLPPINKLSTLAGGPVLIPFKDKIVYTKPIKQIDPFLIQAIREDSEILDIIITLTMSDLI